MGMLVLWRVAKPTQVVVGSDFSGLSGPQDYHFPSPFLFQVFYSYWKSYLLGSSLPSVCWTNPLFLLVMTSFYETLYMGEEDLGIQAECCFHVCLWVGGLDTHQELTRGPKTSHSSLSSPLHPNMLTFHRLRPTVDQQFLVLACKGERSSLMLVSSIKWSKSWFYLLKTVRT